MLTVFPFHRALASSSVVACCSSVASPPLPSAQPSIKTPATFVEYRTSQACLVPSVPIGAEPFDVLRNDPTLVFRDFTPFFKHLRIHDPTLVSTTSLLRGRRWGKTTLGSAWLAYLRKEEALFKGTAVEGLMRKKKLIGVHLDLSQCSSIVDVVDDLGIQVQKGLNAADIHTSWNNPLPSLAELKQLNLNDLAGVVRPFLYFLDDVRYASGLQFALFIDEYDRLVINALNEGFGSEEHRGTNEFFAEFYTKLKASVSTIPFQFITGSSRLAIKGFWNGANAIADLSYAPEMASALGYTWEQIEQCFPTQLGWLEQLHGLTREELKAKMELWYARHRWSSKSDIHVFNPWSVHQFIAKDYIAAFPPSVSAKGMKKKTPPKGRKKAEERTTHSLPASHTQCIAATLNKVKKVLHSTRSFGKSASQPARSAF